MGKSKRKHNWKARLQPDVEIRHDQASEIKIELPGVNEDLYDESNALVLPSKKRATKVRHKQDTTVKKLSKKQRKILENVLKTKNKKAKRAELFESLQKVQASAEELSLLSSTSDMHSGRLKRKVKIEGTTTTEDFKIKSVGGGKKRKIDDSIEEQDESDTSDEPTDEETEDESDTKNEEIKDSISETDEKADLDDTRDNTSEEKKQENACTNKEDEQQQKIKPIVKESPNEAKLVRPTVNIAVHREELIQKQRLKLPILAEEQVIVETINENPVTVIAGETGSGKTTQLPQFLYEAGYAHGDGIIGITEPRRVAAISMSKRVAKELNLTNREVSYQIRYEGNVTEDTKIKFMTDGVLLKEVQKDFLLTKYSVIIIDEAHERSVYTDILIGLLSRIVPLRHKKGNPLKLIIMSATLRVEDFTENERLFKVTPPVLKIDSRQYPVTIHFNKRTPLENYIGEAFKKICKIHRQLPEGGILVFVTGQQEVLTLCSKLRNTLPFHKEGKQSKCSENGKSLTKKPPLPKINLDDYSILPVDEQAEIHEEDNFSGDELMDDSEEDEEELEDKNTSRFAQEQPMHVLPLYSLLSSDKQAKVFEPPPEGSRLCVVATNVAETSLTIPYVKYVVDTGKVKTKFYDKVTGVAAFRVTWTSQAAANQRSGRAGRTGPGHCYRLYSSAVFNDDFEKFSPPEISRRPVDDLVLQMKDMNIDKVLNFPYPTPPSQEALQAAEKLLITLGALEKPITTPSNKKSAPVSTKITKVGRAMASFPVSPRFGKMLCLAHQHNLMAYVVAMVAALSVQEVFVDVHQRYSSQNKEEETTKKTNLLQQRKLWAGAGQSLLLGDLMVLLKAVGACEFADCSPTFCDQYGIRYKAIKEVRKLRAQLTNTVNVVIPDADLVLDPKMRPPDETEAKLLRQIVLAGLADHVARKIPDLPRSPEDAKKLKHAYQSIALEDPVFIHPGSALYKQNCEYVVYQQIDETSKLYMKGISTVKSEWLPLFAPSFCRFSKPLETPEPRYDPSRDSVMCHMTSTFGPHFWAVEAVEVDYPKNAEKYKWFAKAFLGGKVCPKLEKYSRSLLSTPETMLKSWARLQPRTQSILEALMSHDVTSLKSLQFKWKTDKNYLKSEYKEWVPEVLHQEIDQIWPPT